MNQSCYLLKKLFDSLVIPVLLYCSEIWDAFSKYKDSEPHEHIHTKFLKEILGVHSKSCNNACRAELNRIPLTAKIKFNIIKYWAHIVSKENTLLYKIYKETYNTNAWTTHAKNILNRLGYSFIIINPELINLHLTNIKQRIIDIENQEQIKMITMTHKLKLFNQLIKSQSEPPYLNVLHTRKDRSTIAKLRLSAHKLAIEAGRYDNLDVNSRVCLNCNKNQIETEIHFLLSCEQYNQNRNILFKEITNHNPFFMNMSDVSKIKYLLNHKDKKILREIINFITCSLDIRNNK